MAPRVDSASRIIQASPPAIYAALAVATALEQWLPPGNMKGEVLHFDFREGGMYRMRLTYKEPQPGQGKTSQDADEVEVRLTKIEPEKRIEQEVTFESDDPAFAGVMRMIWTLEPEGRGTRVTVRAEDVPEGIRPEDHQAGLNGSLANLARFTEGADSAD